MKYSESYMKWLRDITYPMTENNCNWNSKELKLKAEKIFASQESLVSPISASLKHLLIPLSLLQNQFFFNASYLPK